MTVINKTVVFDGHEYSIPDHIKDEINQLLGAYKDKRVKATVSDADKSEIVAGFVSRTSKDEFKKLKG